MATEVNYSQASPYKDTALYGNILDVLTHRSITKIETDKSYTIDQVYHLRPQILAFDLYQDAALWWVFAVRNPDVLKDPLFDFVVGTTILLPTRDTLVSDLGL
jgi:hypothetical protein